MKYLKKLIAAVVVAGLAMAGTTTSASAHDREDNQRTTQPAPAASTNHHEAEDEDDATYTQPAPAAHGKLIISPRIQRVSTVAGEVMSPTEPITADPVFGTLSFKLDHSTLPNGLVLDPATGVISGTPLSETALVAVILEVRGAQNSESTAVIAINVAPALVAPIATTFVVNFDAATNGGTVATTQITYSSDTGAISLPTPDPLFGFYFTGWYDDPTTGTLIGMAGESFTPTADTVLYAQFVDPNVVVKPAVAATLVKKFTSKSQIANSKILIKKASKGPVKKAAKKATKKSVTNKK